MKKPEWPGIATAVGIILILTIVIASAEPDFKLKDWQTFMAGLLAIAAACIAFLAAMIKVNDDRAARAAENDRMRLSVWLRVDFANREILDRADELSDLLQSAMTRSVWLPPGMANLSIIEPPELEAIWDKLDLLPRHLISEVARVRLLIRVLKRMEERTPTQRMGDGHVVVEKDDLVDFVPVIVEIQDRCKFIHTDLTKRIEELAPSREM